MLNFHLANLSKQLIKMKEEMLNLTGEERLEKLRQMYLPEVDQDGLADHMEVKLKEYFTAMVKDTARYVLSVMKGHDKVEEYENLYNIAIDAVEDSFNNMEKVLFFMFVVNYMKDNNNSESRTMKTVCSIIEHHYGVVLFRTLKDLKVDEVDGFDKYRIEFFNNFDMNVLKQIDAIRAHVYLVESYEGDLSIDGSLSTMLYLMAYSLVLTKEEIGI